MLVLQRSKAQQPLQPGRQLIAPRLHRQHRHRKRLGSMRPWPLNTTPRLEGSGLEIQFHRCGGSGGHAAAQKSWSSVQSAPSSCQAKARAGQSAASRYQSTSLANSAIKARTLTPSQVRMSLLLLGSPPVLEVSSQFLFGEVQPLAFGVHQPAGFR